MLSDTCRDKGTAISIERAHTLNNEHHGWILFGHFARELKARYRLDRGAEAPTDESLTEDRIPIIPTPRQASLRLERECIERFVAN